MEKSKINTQNPEAITFTTEELSFTILGGIRLEGLDRLRVTLKTEVTNRKFVHYLNNPDIADLAIRHSLDLYNDIQVEKLIRKTAERLEVGSSQIAKAISDITNQLEEYRLKRIEEDQKGNKPKPYTMTEQETQEALTLLKSENLLQTTNDYIGKCGIIGEEKKQNPNAHNIYNKKTRNPITHNITWKQWHRQNISTRKRKRTNPRRRQNRNNITIRKRLLLLRQTRTKKQTAII